LAERPIAARRRAVIRSRRWQCARRFAMAAFATKFRVPFKQAWRPDSVRPSGSTRKTRPMKIMVPAW
jgi:hypothetical protein